MARPVLLVPAAQRSAFDASIFRDALDVAGFEVDRTGEELSLSRAKEMSRISLTSPLADLPPILGVLSIGDAEEAATAADALIEAGVLDRRSVLHAIDLAEAERWIAVRLAEFAFGASDRADALSHKLSVLRAAHQDLEDRFAAVEAYAWRVWTRDRPAAYQTGGDAEPTHPDLAGLVGECVLRQRLSFPARALSEIDAPMAPVSEVAAPLEGGALDFELWLLDEDALLASWTISGEAIKRDGCARLVLDRALTLREGALELVVRAGCPEDLVRLRVGPRGPHDEWNARIDGLGVVGGPLALSAWTGPPGLPRRGSLGAMRFRPAPPDGFVRAAPDALESVRLARPIEAEIDFTPVSFWPDQGGALIHPIQGETVIANLPRPFAKPVRAATLVFDHRHEGGAPVELAAIATDDADLARQAFAVNHGQGAPFSGWITLQPGAGAALRLAATTAAPLDGPLFIAARVTPGQGHSYAWAILTDIAYEPA